MTKIIRKLIAAVIILTGLGSGSSAYSQIRPGNLVQYTEQDGLPGAQVNKLLQDKSGYMWVGTINGLARFDGYEFKRLYNNPNDPASIQGMIVWSLFEDRSGNIWIGASPEFLNKYDPVSRTFRQYEFKSLVDHPANMEIGIDCMCQNKKGRIYLGVTSVWYSLSQGLLYLDENEDKIKKFTPPDSLALQNVYRCISDNSGNVWLLSYSGIFKIDQEDKITKIHFLDETLSKNSEYASDIKCDSKGEIWIVSSQSRLYNFDPATGTVRSWSPDKSLITTNELGLINTLAFDRNENIWLGTNPGIRYFDRSKGVFEVFPMEGGKQLAQATTQEILVDSFGALWVGTLLKGLFKYEEKAVLKSISHIQDEPGSLTPGWANHMLEAHDGKIWITTSGQGGLSGINILDPATQVVRAIPFNSLKPRIEHLFDIFESSPDEFYISTAPGFFQLSAKTFTIKKIKFSGVPDTIFINKFREDSRENLWLCTTHGLYKRSKGQAEFKRYDLAGLEGSNASSNEITNAYESPVNGLWLTTHNGLFLYDYSTDKIERHGYGKGAGDSFITQDINALYEDSAGTVWVGLWQGGLSRYDINTRKIVTYTRNEGLPSMGIQGILPDQSNNVLWLSTFEGLSRFSIESGQFNNFSIADGTQSQLFADNSNLKTSQGLFIFGGSNGVNIFTSNEVNKTSAPPLVFLTDVKLFNKRIVPGPQSILKQPVNETNEIVLKHDQNNISIEFMVLHYSNPSRNKCSFKLENFENEWRESGSQHIASYPLLPPGRYVFHVKAANNNGVWNEEGASLNIIITPPWWKTIWAYGLYLLLLVIAGFGADRLLRRRLIQKERERNRSRELEQAKAIEIAYHNLEQSHEQLKATQSQLIQSEKMASLGELTAGIAHEIQNPLNFVNNFSEVSTELLDEMNQEMGKGNLDEANLISADIRQNLEKINHHGKRADAIVKAMLQHSRTSNGLKEPTDINALADEYLRLSYHGLRAKDKSFNASIKTDFNPSIGTINIIPQEIGRVILNLFTNAFYAVNERKKMAEAGYEPTVAVSTVKIEKGIEIRIKDNGTGIPKKVVDKIFQPFFTTKPTGEGTGLGLSLSYDIITKGHGGELKVETIEGEFTEFIIQLPV